MRYQDGQEAKLGLLTTAAATDHRTSGRSAISPRPPMPYGRFTDVKEAKAAYAHEQGAPIVVKTDGLAAGWKGVLLCDTVKEAEKTI